MASTGNARASASSGSSGIAGRSPKTPTSTTSGTRRPKNARIEIPPGTTVETCNRDLKTCTDPEERKLLKQFKRVLKNRSAADKSRKLKRDRLAYLERAFVENGKTIETLRAENAQWKNDAQKWQYSSHRWQSKIQQQQLPPLSQTMAQLPLPAEHVLLPTQGGWGVEYGTINPQHINNAEVVFTQEEEIDYVEAMRRFS